MALSSQSILSSTLRGLFHGLNILERGGCQQDEILCSLFKGYGINNEKRCWDSLLALMTRTREPLGMTLSDMAQQL